MNTSVCQSACVCVRACVAARVNTFYERRVNCCWGYRALAFNSQIMRPSWDV